MKNLTPFLFLLLIFISCKEKSLTGTVPEEGQQQVVSVEDKAKDDLSDLIKVKKPEENVTINSPVVLEGEARGFWFFEGIAPVEITDAKGEKLGRGSIEAEGNWMTEDFVPFKGTLHFMENGEQDGRLILKRSNPSGLPEREMMYQIPVKFGQK